MNVEGHRADLVILKAARALAAFEGRKKINELDIALVAELALLHRMKGGPMQMSEMMPMNCTKKSKSWSVIKNR
jgi:magnesium chelatase subunit I